MKKYRNKSKLVNVLLILNKAAAALIMLTAWYKKNPDAMAIVAIVGGAVNELINLFSPDEPKTKI